MIIIQMLLGITDEYIFTILIHTSRSVCSVRSQIQLIWVPKFIFPLAQKWLKLALTQRRSQWSAHDSDKREASKFHFSGRMFIFSSFTLL